MKRALAILFSFGLAFASYTGYLVFKRPTAGIAAQKVTLWIVPGSSSQRIAEQLVNSGVLDRTWPFKLLIRLTKSHKRLKPGEYFFFAPSSPWEVYQSLLHEQVVQYRITVPEGLTARETVLIFADTLGIAPETFERLLGDEAFKAKLRVTTPRFEGFLFPDTYHFPKTATAERILETLVRSFYRRISDKDLAIAKAKGWSLTQWVTMASIIEKETGLASEYPIVSSVFHNRLKKGMRLQSDPTVIYGIANFNGNLTKKDLQTKTAYNSYTNAGLPPGPISNPGLGALQAALHPAKTEYLYFVATGTGSHVFSNDYATHQRYVAQYQLNQALTPTPSASPSPSPVATVTAPPTKS